MLESLGRGATIVAAAKAAGCHLITVYKWRHSDSVFEAALLDRLAMRVGTVEDAQYTSAVKGNATAQIFFLCNRARDRWQNVSQIEARLTGEITHKGKVDLALLLEAARRNRDAKPSEPANSGGVDAGRGGGSAG